MRIPDKRLTTKTPMVNKCRIAYLFWNADPQTSAGVLKTYMGAYPNKLLKEFRPFFFPKRGQKSKNVGFDLDIFGDRIKSFPYVPISMPHARNIHQKDT